MCGWKMREPDCIELTREITDGEGVDGKGVAGRDARVNCFQLFYQKELPENGTRM